MNARNLEYIQKYNWPESKKFADDKLYTKDFLESRWIWVAKTFRIIQNEKELESLTFKSLPESFVVKPNRGFWWEWIIVIKEKTKTWFKTISWEDISREELYIHTISIIEWKYAITWVSDKAIFEELLEPHKIFDKFLETKWLPDIRIIVFNYVPVLAMIRVPTKESEWKWNLALWAIWIWIDIATWKTNFAYKNWKYIKRLPNWELISWIQIPNWDEILLSASQIQYSTWVWYLWIDLWLTKTWIKTLEINARPWLKIQICNRVPLKARLELVKELKILNPEKWASTTRTLFWNHSSKKDFKFAQVNQKKSIWLHEPINIYIEWVNTIMAKIDPFSEENYISYSYQKEDGMLDFSIQNKRQKWFFKSVVLRWKPYKAIIWKKYLWDFLIDTNLQNEIDTKAIDEVNEKRLKNVDKKVCEIDKKLKYMSYLKPLNLTEEKEKFLENPNFNPQFEYKEFDEDEFDELKKDIAKIPREIDHLLMPIYDKKIKELGLKIKLIESRNTKRFWEISEKLFWKIEHNNYKDAINLIKKEDIKEDKSKILEVNEVIKKLEKFLEEKRLMTWKIKKLESATADMSVTKKWVIFISNQAKISEERLAWLIAHEIETHVYRSENWKLQDFEIFQRWTDWYLETEEWLAIYNQKRAWASVWGVKLAYRLIWIYMWRRMSFLELYHYMIDTFSLDKNEAWKTCLKCKRWLEDTSLHTTYTKDAIYFTGNKKIEKFMKNASEEEILRLYSWKISLDDMKILKEFHFEKPRFISSAILEIIKNKK